ncbi:zf-HC2 domain-containing protein [Streptomyces sp. LX-29]|uniref:zf-HC2 domain-containing protein n=1 Tax=Streptomyces sp. LX-29 TaxID=2900152 RepID=UPI00240D7E5B|nr:zf-HC2 domain-containing protein [Streptomyces sp. LX-29]WFB09213.1 zf-HC2 domain-containing protein [Streptomyces sp. LX-29]
MTPPAQHSDVGAYALGILDDADATRFEEHLVECDRCAAELEELMGLTPALAEFAQTAPTPETITATPGPELLDRLLAEVGATRAKRRRGRLYLVAAAAALIVAAPLVTAVAVREDSGAGEPRTFAAAARQVYEAGDRLPGTVDPVTKVSAEVSLESQGWRGTYVALKLGNVKGQRECQLIAVGKSGTEEVVSTWAVPEGGYGVPGDGSKWNKEPLYTLGGAAMNRDEIDRFEVRTLKGERLATVKV